MQKAQFTRAREWISPVRELNNYLVRFPANKETDDLDPAYNKAGQKLQSLHHLADRLGWFCTRQSARDSERGNSG